MSENEAAENRNIQSGSESGRNSLDRIASSQSLNNISEISEKDYHEREHDDTSDVQSDGGVVFNADNLSEYDLDDDDNEETGETNGGVERGLSWDEYSEEAGKKGGKGSISQQSVDNISLIPMTGGNAMAVDGESQSGILNAGPSLADLELEAVTLVGSDDLDRLKAINLEIIARVESNASSKNYPTLIDAYLALSDVYLRQNNYREAYNQKILAINVKQTLAPAANSYELHYVIQQYCDIGSLSRMAGDFDHSEWYFSEAYYLALDLVGETGKEMGPVLLGYGELTLEKGQVASAVIYLERSLELLHNDPNCNQDLKTHAKYSLAKALKVQAQEAFLRSEAILGMGSSAGSYFPNSSFNSGLERMSSITSMHSDGQKIARQQNILVDLQQGGHGIDRGIGILEGSTISTYPYDNRGGSVIQDGSNNLSIISHNYDQLGLPFLQDGGLNEGSVATNNENESYFTEIETLPLEQESSLYADLAFAGDDVESASLEEAELVQSNLIALSQQRLLREKEEAVKREEEMLKQQLMDERKEKERAERRARVLSARRKKEIEDYKYGFKMKITNNIVYFCCVPIEFGTEKKINFSKVVCNSSDKDDEMSLSASIASKQSSMEKSINTTDRGIKEYLCRTKDESAYYESVNKIYHTPCFPVDKLLKKHGKYRPDVIELAQYVVSYRVRRLVIEDEISVLQKEITATENLQEVCAMKARLITDRIVMLEREMTKQTTQVVLTSKYDERFSYMLSTHIGWNVIVTYLNREFKRLNNKSNNQNGDAHLHVPGLDADESIDRNLTLETVKNTWSLIQEWMLVHSVVLRCKLGKDGYPVPPRNPPAPTNGVPTDGEEETNSGNSKNANANAKREGHKDGELPHKGHHEKLTPLPHLDFECIAEWESLCDFFELPPIQTEESEPPVPDYRLLSVLKKMKERIEDNPNPYFGLSNVLLQDIALGIYELTEFDTESQFLGASFSQVMSYIGDLIEKEIMLSLRHYSMWSKILERMRKERVKRANGKLIVKEHGVLEIDFYGNEFMIPHAEMHVDTDLVHHSMQRIYLHILTPILEKKYEVASEKAHKLRGELQVLVQCVYMHAAPYIQRAIRGALQRMKTPAVMRDLALHSMNAACLLLQSWLRSKVGKSKFLEQIAARKANFKNKSAYTIQNWIRSYCKWKIYQRYLTDKKEKSLWYAVSNFQAMIRGFNDRKRLEKERNKAEEALKKEIQDWSVICIQKLARGYIARKTVVKSLRIRKALSNQTLEIAERYLKTGNLWRFLKEIDGEISRLNTELSDTQKREDNWADSFIKQVLDKRKSDFDSSWNRFSKAVKPNITVTGSAKPAEIGDDFLLSAIGDVDTNMISNRLPTEYFGESSAASNNGKGRNSKALHSRGGKERLDDDLSANTRSMSSNSKLSRGQMSGKNTINPSSGPGRTNFPGQKSMESAMSGPLLRRAVTTTIQESVKSEIERQKLAEAKNSKLLDDIKDCYGSQGAAILKQNVTTLSPIKPGRKPKKDLLGRKIENKGKIQSTSSDWVSKAATHGGDDITVGSTGSASTTTIRTISSEPVSNSSSESPTTTKRGKRDKSPVRTVDKAFGENLLIDVPLGVDDTIEHLLHAASLRSYVPEIFSGKSHEEAYAMYKQLPKGLARMKYEAEAWKWSQVFINRLRQKGLTRIKQLLPMTFFRNHLKSVEAPSLLINKVVDLYLDLKKIGEDAFKTSENENAKSSYKKVKEGFITLEQEVELAKAFPHYSVASVADQSQALSSNEIGSSVAATCDSTNSANPELPSRLLLQMVEGGAWTDLKSPMEDLLMYAAYLVIPFVPYSLDKSKKRRKPVSGDDSSSVDTELVSIEDESSKMSQYAFKRHINEVQNLENEFDKREAIKNRFRAALIITTPYILRLQAEGISTVFDLVKVDFDRFKMPAQLQNQVESCLSVAVSLSKNAKIVPTIRDHLSTSEDLFTVAMIYDPKFQRGPFDPYGKPSPLLPLRDIIKAKKIQNAKADSLKTNQETAYPEAIWNKSSEKPNFDESASKKMFDFNMHSKHEDPGIEIPDSSLHEATVIRNSISRDTNSRQSNNNKDKEKMHLHYSEQKDHDHGGKLDTKVSFSSDVSGENHELTTKTTSSTKSGILKKSVSLSNLTGSKETTSSTSASSDTSTKTAKMASVKVKASMTAAQVRKAHQDEEMKIFKKDFQQHAKEDFRRPYKCSFPGCHHAFSRHYNLKIHEKGHRMFEAYHSYKYDPQLFYDMDTAAIKEEQALEYEAKVGLPPIAQSYVNTLTYQAQMSQTRLSQEEMRYQLKSRERDVDRSYRGSESSSFSPLRTTYHNNNNTMSLTDNISRVSAAKYDSSNAAVTEIFGLKFGSSLGVRDGGQGLEEGKLGQGDGDDARKSVSFRDDVAYDNAGEGGDDDYNDDDTWYRDETFKDTANRSVDQFSESVEDARGSTRFPKVMKNTIFGDDALHEGYSNRSYSPQKSKSYSREIGSSQGGRPSSETSADRDTLLEFYSSIHSQARSGSEDKSGNSAIIGDNELIKELLRGSRNANNNPFVDDYDKIYENVTL